MLALTAALAAGVVGCAEAADPATAPTAAPTASASTPAPTPTPAPTAAVPDIPRVDAAAGGTPVAVVAPVQVQVPDLGIDVAVDPEGTTDDGSLALDEDPGRASWYRYGPSPWSPKGSAVIAAHVDSFEYGLGDFASLASASAGQQVLVTGSDGSTAAFTVTTVQTLEKTGIDWNAVFERDGERKLTLITCGGEFDYDTGHYLSNVIVTAVPSS
ncbi:class F sortase [Cnuibacter physcomitrellae]|uniref:class F sortase n=1 Tax=Cnuibacter physcomitrellae TaxID=1619308 RepID=UPI0021757D91|nr:class F sortase [Cnuibacter physcomitrellae]MCS5495637.1 class F sortase [Cnuibacter physcomitrellae]